MIRLNQFHKEAKTIKKTGRGQSTLEYVIILAAVVGAIIAVAATLKPKIRDTYDKLGDKVKTKVESVTFD